MAKRKPGSGGGPWLVAILGLALAGGLGAPYILGGPSARAAPDGAVQLVNHASAGTLLAQAAAGTDEETGFATDESRKPAVAGRYMVAAANPIAAAIGRDILRNGGSAVDAAIAVQIALTLVEPQSSGIGGGAFLIHSDANGNRIDSYDGRETVAAAARPDLFLTADGKPKPREQTRTGGIAVGVPGVLRMLELAHREQIGRAHV